MPTTNTLIRPAVSIPLNGNALLRPIGCSVNYYDGAAFTGLAVGEIGDHGVVMRSESLVINDAQINDSYNTLPECFKPSPNWGAYPALFQSGLQNSDVRLGYIQHTDEPFAEGWYKVDVKNKYDFQDGSLPYERGLVVQSKDCFDNLSEIVYDDYGFMPAEARQYYDNTTPLYLSTAAQYDYRLFKPVQVNDENQNRSRFDYSPLGLLNGIALIGQYDKDEGDIVTESPLTYVPSTRFEYNLLQFYQDQHPVWVKTIQREQHWQDDPTTDSPTIQKIEFSDGFGRVLQSRAQAEDLLFYSGSAANALSGDSGLPIDQGSNANAVGHLKPGTTADNVVVSGWKVYNNKGKVVEEYEPFFSAGYAYQSAKAFRFQLQKMSIRYDAGGRPTETTFPDGSKSLVVYGVPNNIGSPPLFGSTGTGFARTPWERYAYDQNDLAPLTTSGSGSFTGAFTPKSELVDALGRTIQTTEHKSQATANSAVFEDVVMRYEYDIQGNLIRVLDPYDRQVFRYWYNMQQQPLRTLHIDSGNSRVLIDVLGKPILANNDANFLVMSTYDRLQRPVYGWSVNLSTGPLQMIARTEYGESATSAQDHNLLGKPYIQYDESGKVTMPDYDFKGNPLAKIRNVISSATLKTTLNSYAPYYVDWTSLPSILDSFDYRTDTAYDALNRITQITLPEDVNTDRKTIVPTYNRAGALDKVSYDSTQYVSQIGYSAKGQRLLIAFGNHVMTRYAYDPVTFKLLRQRSEKFTKTIVGNTVTYAYDTGTNRQDDGFQYDLVGNILKILNRKTDCGITGSSLGADALDRSFTYDPLYRLASATGRESDTQNQNDYLYADAPFPGSPNADNVRAYTRKYTYDKLGNVQQLRQTASGNSFTRNFNYITDTNKLDEIVDGSSSLIQDFGYDAAGNQTQAGSNRFYQWDAANQLIIYKNQAGASDPTIYAQYQYAGGTRISKMVRTGTAGSPIYERSIYIDGIFEYHKLENGSTYEKNYVHVMDDRSRIAMVRIGTPFPDDIGDATTYVLEDQIGSSVTRLNTSGAAIDMEEFYPFGDSSLRTFTKKRYRYVGKEKDLESGLYYYGARYYAAWTCRFISVDPLADKYAQLTPYNNASNSPVTSLDIDGMQTPDQETSKGSDETGDGGGSDSGGSTTLSDNLNVVESGEVRVPVGQQVVFDHGDITKTITELPTFEVTPLSQSTSDIQQNVSKLSLSSRELVLGDLSAYQMLGRFDYMEMHKKKGLHDITLYGSTATFCQVIMNNDRMTPEAKSEYFKLRVVEGPGRQWAAQVAGTILLAATEGMSAPSLGLSPRFGPTLNAARTSSRAFFSGAGTEARAIKGGFTTLSQTRAGQNLMKMTEGMPYYPGSQAYNWWARLSSTYAKGIPKGSNVNVFLNNPSPTGIWNAVEKPILQQRGINIIYK